MAANAKKWILTIAGIGTVALSAAAATYLLMKRDVDDDVVDYLLGAPEEVVKRLKIPRRSISTIVGRGGETVSQIENQTEARIKFEEDSDPNIRIAVIRGTKESVEKAESAIQLVLENQPVIFTEEITIPQHAVGSVIGKGGETIKSICQTSGARVDVAKKEKSANSDALNSVSIKGTPEQIKLAKRMIEEIVAQSEVRHAKQASSSNQRLAIQSASDWNKDVPEPSSNVEELVGTLDNGFLQVYVSAVESPSRFWLQVYGPKGTQLDKLSDTMTDFYEIEANRVRTSLSSVELKVGDIVAAPYHLDENYYRVRVVDIDEKEQQYAPEETPVRVFYLDFGDEHTHPKKALCSLEENFLSDLPFQAVECALNAFSHKTIDWSDDAVSFFVAATYAAQWKAVLAKPYRKISCPSGPGKLVLVDLLDPYSEGEANLASLLVSKSYATF
ncbi:Tudor and KH domain-containing protein [Halotydeus destructor]|nr:Tudor and KH domain-containing protein [Halotydeus destructor]